MERASLIVIENSTYSRAVFEHHGVGRIGFERWPIRRPHDHCHGCFRIVCEARRHIGTLLLEHGLFDFGTEREVLTPPERLILDPPWSLETLSKRRTWIGSAR